MKLQPQRMMNYGQRAIVAPGRLQLNEFKWIRSAANEESTNKKAKYVDVILQI